MKYKVNHQGFDFQFSDEDIVNPDDCIPSGESNPHNVHAFVLHESEYVHAVVFADCLQDAIDTAVDQNKLSQFKAEEFTPKDGEEYPPNISYLGNYGKPYDIESLEAFEIPASRWKRVLELKD